MFKIGARSYHTDVKTLATSDRCEALKYVNWKSGKYAKGSTFP